CARGEGGGLHSW
nr:immunoglobulin heavy chain junction region [Macaca mulatta]